MEGSLPDMEGGWDAFFDEYYMRTYEPFLTDERAREETNGAVRLAGIEPGAEVLDCPCGFARHAALLAAAGYRATGADRSETQLAEARRRIGEAEWPRLVRADYRELPFADASFDAVLNLFTSLGYVGKEGDQGVLRELRRVLRPGGPLVLETMHRDRIVKHFTQKGWDELADGSFFLQEREWDPVASTVTMRHILVPAGGKPQERRIVHRAYSVTELTEMLGAASFAEVECFGDWEGAGPPSTETRLIVRAR